MTTKVLDSINQDYSDCSLPVAKRKLFEVLRCFKFKTDDELFSFLKSRLNDPAVWKNCDSKKYANFLKELRSEAEQLVL